MIDAVTRDAQTKDRTSESRGKLTTESKMEATRERADGATGTDIGRVGKDSPAGRAGELQAIGLQVGRPGPKRTKHQRLRDRHLVSQWRTVGLTLGEITARLTEVTRTEGYVLVESSVFRDIQAVEREWRAAVMINVNDYKARQLARLQWMWREAVTAWEESKQNCEETTTSRRERYIVATSLPGTTEGWVIGSIGTETRTIERLPDPRWLSVMLAILQREAKLQGLDGFAGPSDAATPGVPRGAVPAPRVEPQEDAAALLVGLVSG